MSEKPIDTPSASAEILHLAAFQKPRPASENIKEIASEITSHFREQNSILSERNASLVAAVQAMHTKIDRLTNGLGMLVEEMHGIRTGKRKEAFARVGDIGSSVDLPTVRSDPAGIYTVTAGEIGKSLTFQASEIGLLLGKRGLKWVDNPDYQETIRRKLPTQQRFWVYDMAARLTRILDENQPECHGIMDKAVLSMFRRWHKRRADSMKGRDKTSLLSGVFRTNHL